MAVVQSGRGFNRDSMASWYANSHLQTDPGILEVYFLPENSGEREIRLLEVNELIGDRNDDSLTPIDFGVDAGMETAHRLLVLDVTPDQWRRIASGELELPADWALQKSICYRNE